MENPLKISKAGSSNKIIYNNDSRISNLNYKKIAINTKFLNKTSSMPEILKKKQEIQRYSNPTRNFVDNNNKTKVFNQSMKSGNKLVSSQNSPFEVKPTSGKFLSRILNKSIKPKIDTLEKRNLLMNKSSKSLLNINKNTKKSSLQKNKSCSSVVNTEESFKSNSIIKINVTKKKIHNLDLISSDCLNSSLKFDGESIINVNKCVNDDNDLLVMNNYILCTAPNQNSNYHNSSMNLDENKEKTNEFNLKYNDELKNSQSKSIIYDSMKSNKFKRYLYNVNINKCYTSTEYSEKLRSSHKTSIDKFANDSTFNKKDSIDHRMINQNNKRESAKKVSLLSSSKSMNTRNMMNHFKLSDVSKNLENDNIDITTSKYDQESINSQRKIKLLEIRIDNLKKHITIFKNELKNSSFYIKKETNSGYEMQINRIIKENKFNHIKIDELRKEIIDMRNDLFKASDRTKEYSEQIKFESSIINKLQRDVTRYNKLISDTFVY